MTVLVAGGWPVVRVTSAGVVEDGHVCAQWGRGFTGDVSWCLCGRNRLEAQLRLDGLLGSLLWRHSACCLVEGRR